MEKVYELKKILDENNIENGIDEIQSINATETNKVLTFKFPVAREYDEIRILATNSTVDSILQSDFLKYRGISDYEAIWSSELGCIECEIDTSISHPVPPRIFLRRILKLMNPNGDSNVITASDQENPLRFTLYSSDKIKVFLGYSSKEFYLLSTQKYKGVWGFDDNPQRYKLTIRIENIAIKTQEEAKKVLEKISNTLFYQLDLRYGLTVTLSPRRETYSERIQKNKQMAISEPIKFNELGLQYEYDEIPMALYWLAQRNNHSPIFKYFALYQVIEYYYPIYSIMNAKNKIQNIIKDPKFNVNKDSDVVRLLTIIKTTNTGNIGDEREQLNVTLRNVISGEDIIDFIAENPTLKDYYSGKNSKKLYNQKLRLNDNIGIIDDVATRIYEIRCSIVHNKASETNTKILPMTQEVDYLINEVKLLNFIAQKTIIANSRPFDLR